MVAIVDYRMKAQLAERVKLGSYYQDGTDLFEVEALSANGSIVIRDCRSGQTRGVGIEMFRKRYWLVREAHPPPSGL